MRLETSGTRPPGSAGQSGELERRFTLPFPRLRTSERKLLLVVVDAVIINAALLLAWRLGSDLDATVLDLLAPYKWYITLTIVWYLSALLFDLYDLARAASTYNIVRNSLAAVLVTVLVYSLIPSLSPPLLRRTLIFLFTGFAVVGIVGWRIAYVQLFVQPWFTQRALVVGAGWAGRTLVQEMALAPQDANPYRGTGYELLGFIDDDPNYEGTDVDGIPVLGGQEVLIPMAEALQVEEVIVAITHRHAMADELFDDLLRCRELGIHVSPMSTVYERLLGRVPVLHVGRDLFTALPTKDESSYRLYRIFKRGVDLLSASVGLLVLAVVAPLIALVNAVTSPGPLFYDQERVGKGGRTFGCYKFRSMIPDAEADTGAVWAQSDDDRITPVGRVIRRARIDELPQFINVLKGDMSLIGPRPERPQFVETLSHTIPFYRARHAMRPGITGWAQVQYDYGSSEEDSRIKLEYDLYYVKHAGPMLDLRILLQTVSVMLQFKGR
ncbi:MAG: sugar transferase [Chloroflexota bacterium]|nr:sugar transferase [Chloroflexota bacterium]